MSIELPKWVDGAGLLDFVIFERASPLPRPRINKHTGSIYQPIDSQNKVRKALLEIEQEPIDVPFILEADFYFEKKEYFLKVDVDNLLKALADNLQAMKIITNDRLMMGSRVTKNLYEDFICLRLIRAEKELIPLDLIS